MKSKAALFKKHLFICRLALVTGCPSHVSMPSTSRVISSCTLWRAMALTQSSTWRYVWDHHRTPCTLTNKFALHALIYFITCSLLRRYPRIRLSDSRYLTRQLGGTMKSARGQTIGASPPKSLWTWLCSGWRSEYSGGNVVQLRDSGGDGLSGPGRRPRGLAPTLRSLWSRVISLQYCSCRMQWFSSASWVFHLLFWFQKVGFVAVLPADHSNSYEEWVWSRLVKCHALNHSCVLGRFQMSSGSTAVLQKRGVAF